MNKIIYEISKLPQVLQDNIGEFNVEHRPLMKHVLAEIKYVNCQEKCGERMLRIDTHYFTTIFCSKWCKSINKYNNRIKKRAIKLPQFLKHNYGIYDEEHLQFMEDVYEQIEYVECFIECGGRVSRKLKNSKRRELFCSSWCETSYYEEIKGNRRSQRKRQNL
jgi:endogenous inhibitor of DNA gyrase (YacG/DUF329 family)